MYEDLSIIDTDAKAYFLGWISSMESPVKNQSLTLTASQDRVSVIMRLVESLFPNVVCQVLVRKGVVHFIWEQPDLVEQARLQLARIAESKYLSDAIKDTLCWEYVRGMFEGNGSLNHPTDGSPYPICTLRCPSERLLSPVRDFIAITGRQIDNSVLEYHYNSALDFLGFLYNGLQPQWCLPSFYQAFVAWCSWVPGFSDRKGEPLRLRFYKTDPRAIVPSKTRISNPGYDLTIIEHIGRKGAVDMYDTGISIEPEYGWGFLIAPLSSTPESGYLLVNGFDVINRSYNSSLVVRLYKFDQSAPDLPLPYRIAQLIPVPFVHFQPVF